MESTMLRHSTSSGSLPHVVSDFRFWMSALYFSHFSVKIAVSFSWIVLQFTACDKLVVCELLLLSRHYIKQAREIPTTCSPGWKQGFLTWVPGRIQTDWVTESRSTAPTSNIHAAQPPGVHSFLFFYIPTMIASNLPAGIGTIRRRSDRSFGTKLAAAIYCWHEFRHNELWASVCSINVVCLVYIVLRLFRVTVDGK